MNQESTFIRRAPHKLMLIALTLGLFSGALAGENPASFEEALLDVQHRWAQANYAETGRAQKQAFDALLDDARALVAENPSRAEALVWRGIVASTYAGVKGPFGAMSLANEARDSLLAAEALDPNVLDGSVYTSLGTLYFKVPGGLIGFGDDDVALEYLRKALELNPDGIDPNFFYAEFMYDHEDYDAAREALLRAQTAPERADRPLADEGRQREVAALLEQVNRRLQRG